jgi:hypothetical protein
LCRWCRLVLSNLWKKRLNYSMQFLKSSVPHFWSTG